MCLGVPGKVISICDEGDRATVDFWGVRREIRLDVVDEPVAPGDYILNHVGFAIRRIPASEIGATLALYEELIRRADESDLMASDVRGEIRAGAPSGHVPLERDTGGVLVEHDAGGAACPVLRRSDG